LYRSQSGSEHRNGIREEARGSEDARVRVGVDRPELQCEAEVDESRNGLGEDERKGDADF
jgi:hypothetical protein